ncbi:DMT family transporter [Pontibaca salina]|uniref:DMT family transporter n=1 Tax=Pontibaca salina TaxID=2795731 RepID=A0A934HMW3_9RHOB|nr:DMT family transporter [Pontibaca salina]MBI6631008.1 DMT family transporter [Pontibaca salina]
MISLIFGLIAALCWGIHDICVRYVSQQVGAFPALATILIVAALLTTPFAILFGDWRAMDLSAIALAAASGAVFTVAYLGLYKAFEIGPVRLVAPILGAYPVLSVGWAALSGQGVSWDQWFAVGGVITGVAIVGLLSRDDESGGSQSAAIIWAVLGGTGFAGTFALGHAAAHAGSELPVILVTQIVAVLGAIVLLLAAGGIRLPTRNALPMLGFMGLLDCVALGIVIAAAGMARPEFAAVASSTFGMITVILAWLILRERVSPGQWYGVAITFTAIGYLAI